LEFNGAKFELKMFNQSADIEPNSKSGKRSNDSAVLAVLRNAICSHQGDIAQHIFWGAELHKRLRLATDPEVIKAIIGDIESDLPDIFQRAWRITVGHLINYFKLTHSSSLLPRMCIKDTIEKGGKKYIIDIFREDGGRSSIQYTISENTGFHSVERDGRFFLCNDIPSAVKTGNYINPRLDLLAAKKYKSPGRMDRIFRDKQKLNIAWAECWSDFSHEKDNSSSCYKSTLIVPMTLVNCHLGKEFSRDTVIGKSQRQIYGFLCFDHPHKDYFNENDINIGYIFADLLSFYQINQHSITTHSETFESKRSFINYKEPLL